MDCPHWSTREVVLILLAAGIDTSILSYKENKTAFQLAMENPSTAAFEAFNYFNASDEDAEAKGYISKLKSELDTKYTFQKRMRLQVEQFDSNFDVPDFIFEKQQAGCIPEDMTIFEHQLKPLMDDASIINSSSSSSLRSLEFTRKEAIINQQRRMKIVKSGNDDWVPEADVPSLLR